MIVKAKPFHWTESLEKQRSFFEKRSRSQGNVNLKKDNKVLSNGS